MNNFNDNKAGLDGLDKDRIQRVVASSTSSNFGSHYAKRQQRVDERCRRMREHVDALSSAQLRQCEQEADAVLETLEQQRDLGRVVVHIDMDAFFAAVEMRDEPTLRVVPMAVGGESMLSTSNYVARRYGIRSGMPGFIARKLCPELTIVRGDYDKYRRVSAVVRSVFLRYDQNVHMGGLDEACLDITELVAGRLEPVTLTRIRYDGRDGRCICRLPLLSDEECTAIIGSGGDMATKSDRREGSAEGNDVPSAQPSESVDENLSAKSASALGGNVAHDTKATNSDRPSSNDDRSEEELDKASTSQPEWKELLCAKCEKTRRAYVDSVEFGTSVDEVVNEIRFQVRQETGLTCSAGIGANWLLAKVCSDMRKPNGQFRVANERFAIIEFMRSLPVRKVPGVGGVTESLLKGFAAVTKCEDLIEKRAELRAAFSDLQFHFFMSIALGVHGDGADHDDERGRNDDAGGDRRSISIERTFTPQNTPAVLLAECDQLCEALIADCTSRGVAGGRTATVKIKFASFDVVTRAKSADRLINTVELLRPIALELLRNELTSRRWPKVRLLGVRLSRLEFVGGKTAVDNGSPKTQQKTMADFLRRRPSLPANEIAEVIDLNENDDEDISEENVNEKVAKNIIGEFAKNENIQPTDYQDRNDNDEIVSLPVDESKPTTSVKSNDDEDDDDILIIYSTVTSQQPALHPKKSADEKTKKRRPATSDNQPKSKKPSLPVNTLNRYFPMVM